MTPELQIALVASASALLGAAVAGLTQYLLARHAAKSAFATVRRDEKKEVLVSLLEKQVLFSTLMNELGNNIIRGDDHEANHTGMAAREVLEAFQLDAIKATVLAEDSAGWLATFNFLEGLYVRVEIDYKAKAVTIASMEAVMSTLHHFQEQRIAAVREELGNSG